MNYYQIADAAKRVNVESHVLRYWEEELQLPIERNKQGHRLYTDEDLNRFLYIKELKKEGLQLRAIRTKVHMRDKQIEQGTYVPEKITESREWDSKQETDTTGSGEWEKKQPQEAPVIQEQQEKRLPKCGNRSADAAQLEEEKTRKAARLCMMLQQMVVTAVHEENKEFLREIKKGVAETVSKEMNYQFSMQEQREEEHYKKLDEILRERERHNRMTLGDRKRLKKEHQRAEKEKQRAEKENARREKEKMQQEQARREKEKQQEKENARREKEKQQREKEQARREKEKVQQEQARREKEKQKQEKENARREKEKVQQMRIRGSLFGGRQKSGQEQSARTS